jgi:uncharacterized protein DUF2846
MRFLRVLSPIVMFVAASAFARGQDATAQADGKQATATVYFYRYKQFVGGALEPSVYCDDAQLARMDNGRYFALKLEAGKHTLHSNDKQSGIGLDAKAGQQYFVRMEIATGFAKGHGRLVLMSPEQGSYELKSSKLKPLDAGKVVDKARVSIEEAQLQPAPAPAPKPAAPTPQLQPVSQTTTSSNGEHPIQGSTVSEPNDGAGTASQVGEPTSLGEAARRAKQKKQQQPPPQ